MSYEDERTSAKAADSFWSVVMRSLAAAAPLAEARVWSLNDRIDAGTTGASDSAVGGEADGASAASGVALTLVAAAGGVDSKACSSASELTYAARASRASASTR
jgi:hypothetical protein